MLLLFILLLMIFASIWMSLFSFETLISVIKEFKQFIKDNFIKGESIYLKIRKIFTSKILYKFILVLFGFLFFSICGCLFIGLLILCYL